jgi:hypothetical protein
MARRFLLGLMKGLLLGAALSLLWVKGFGAPFSGVLAYLAALVTGSLVGLIAGKPIWQKGALVEVVLKTVVGALVGVAALYGMQKWLGVALDLGPLGSGRMGELPTFALPAIATALAIVFELDNTGAEPTDDQRARVLAPSHEVRDDLPGDLEDVEKARPSLGAHRKS